MQLSHCSELVSKDTVASLFLLFSLEDAITFVLIAQPVSSWIYRFVLESLSFKYERFEFQWSKWNNNSCKLDRVKCPEIRSKSLTILRSQDDQLRFTWASFLTRKFTPSHERKVGYKHFSKLNWNFRVLLQRPCTQFTNKFLCIQWGKKCECSLKYNIVKQTAFIQRRFYSDVYLFVRLLLEHRGEKYLI